MSTPSPIKNEGQGEAPGPSRDSESVRDFVSIALHDLREPLRAIRLGAQLLGSNGRAAADENAVKGTRFITEAVDRVELLLHDIREYCCEEFRGTDFRETDLELVLREAQTDRAQEIKNCGAVITHDPLPIVLGNFSSLATAMGCLIGNACKFRSQAAPVIHVGAMQQEKDCVVSVSDNGQGFDPVYSERIFRPFERLNGKQYPGSGLGLTIAKKIIENHGGRIWAESRPGSGSTFRFNVPAAG